MNFEEKNLKQNSHFVISFKCIICRMKGLKKKTCVLQKDMHTYIHTYIHTNKMIHRGALHF